MNSLDTRALPARILASRLRIRTAVVNGLVATALAASQFQAVAATDSRQTARDALGSSTSSGPATHTRPVFSRPSPRLDPLQQAETETLTPTPTETLTETATQIPSETATETPTETSTPEMTGTPTETVTPTPDLTGTPTATPTGETKGPLLTLEAIPPEVAPGTSVVIHWRIDWLDLSPAEDPLAKEAPEAVLQFYLPPSIELVDPSKTGLDAKALSAPLPKDLLEDEVVFVLLPEAELPLVIKAELLVDEKPVASASVELVLPKAIEEEVGEGGETLLTEGVKVEWSFCQKPHPWVWCSTPVTVCTQGSTLPGTSGMCKVTWSFANGTGHTFTGWAGWNLGLEATPDYTPVYHTSEVSHCMAGNFNRTVDCVLEGLLRGEWFSADEWMTIPPNTSYIPMERVFYWTLDPAHWWVASRSGRSACSGEDGRECPLTNGAKSQSPWPGNSINSYTGGLDYPATDLSVGTAGGPLVMERYYSSSATSAYTSPLGYGWAHNQDTRLIFPGTTGGESGVVWFKAHSTNQYAFLDNGNGTYTATGGVLATLTKNAGPPVTYTVKTVYQSTYVFNSAGRLTTWTDAQGHTWTYTYDGSNRLDLVTDSSGTRFLDLAYDASGRLSTVVDQTGRGVTYGYNASGDLSSVVDARGETWTYTYGASHRLRLVTDPNGVTVVRTEYDTKGRAYQQYDPSGTLILQLTYNSNGTTTVTDALAHADIHTFDNRRTLVGAQDAAGEDISKAYDNQLRPTNITDRNGNPTSLTWSSNGANLTRIIDAEDAQVDLTYDVRNNLRQVTDARQAITTYSFNENDPDPAKQTLLNSTTNALDQATSFTYTTSADAPQPPGLLKTITDPLGHTTSFTYNATGQRLTSTDALGRTTEYTYDSLGRLKITEDPAGRKNWTCYDAAGHVVRSVENASGSGGSPQTDPCDAASYVPSGEVDEDRISTTVYDDGGRAIATIDPSGVITRTYFDSDNRPQYVVQNLAGQGIEVGTPPAYDPDHPDRNIRSQTVYDDNGNPIASIDTLGIITRTYYDTLDRPQYVVSNLVGQDIGVGTPPSYNPSYPDRNVRTRTYYDAAGNMTATEDNAGVITRTYYDGNNRPVTVVQNLTGQGVSDPNPPSRNPATPDQNLRTDTTYDDNGNAIATTNPAEVITRTYFDALNRPITVAQNLIGQGIGEEAPPTYNPAYPDRNLLTDTYYDDAGNAIATVDTLGVITRTYFDNANRPVYVVRNLTGQGIYVTSPPAYNPTYPDRNVRTQTVYDDTGRAIATIDTLGHITRTYYDGLGRVRYVVQNLTGQGIEVSTPPAYSPANPDQNVRSETVYDDEGDAVAAIDNAGRITRTYYDDLHRARYVTQNLTGQGISVGTPPAYNAAYPDQNVTSETVYNGVGSVVRSIDPVGKLAYSCYDGLQRMVKSIENPSVSSPCGSYSPGADTDRDIITLTTYGAAGNRRTSTDPNSKVTTFDYDDVSRLVSETDPLAHATTYGYDVAGNRTSMTDARSVATKYEYDAVGRLTAVVENYRPGITPDHEINVRTEYTYDGAGSRTSILDARSHTTTLSYDDLGRLVSETDALSHAWTFGYDGLGNRLTLLDANGATTGFSFDALGRPTAIDYPAPDADVAFTYDDAGNRHTMVDGVGTTTWTYDDLDRPTAVQDPFSGTVSYGYDGAGHRTSLTYPDTKQVGYTYDLAGRLQLVTDWDSLATTYTYDRGSRSATTTFPNSLVSTYTFDDASRLTSLAHVHAGNTVSSFTYTYDEVGNRTSASEVMGGTTSIAYTYDPLYRLTAADYNGGTSYFHYTYDAVGNRLTEVTQGGTTTYVYDDANRLTSVGGVTYTWDNNGNLLSDGASTYTYDHANRLASVVQGGTTYGYGYNGLGDRLRQTVGGTPTSYTLDLAAGLTQMLGDGTNTYLYGTSRIGEKQPAGWRYHVGDALGSVRQLVDSVGGVALAKSYAPFGTTLTSVGTGTSAFAFAGEQADATGLVYLRARYLSPYLNQWIQPDPIVSDPHIPADWNRYSYVRNNPVRYTDPSGQCIDADFDGRCDWWPTIRRDQPQPTTANARSNTLAVLDVLSAYDDCGPRIPVYDYVVQVEIQRIERTYGVDLDVHEINEKKGEWRLGALGTLEDALSTVGSRLRNAIDRQTWRNSGANGAMPSPQEMFKRVFSPLTFLRGPVDMKYYPGHLWFGRASQGKRIYLYGLEQHWTNGTMFELILHELGHILDQRQPSRYSGGMNSEVALRDAIANIQSEEYYRTGPNDPRQKETLGTESGLGVNWRSSTGVDEIWADLFASWATGQYGSARYAPLWKAFVNSLMRDVATLNAING